MNAIPSPGARLKQAREAQGKSLSDVAKATRIGMQQLEGIERDNYDRIPAAVYVKGFVKNYAQSLGLDPAPLLADVERLLSGETEEPPLTESSATVPEPLSEQEEEAPVVRKPLQPGISLPQLPYLASVKEKLSTFLKSLANDSFPLDRRLGFILGTVVVILILVFGLRSCAGSSDEPTTAEELPVEALENLLIATPEPILFELPRTTP